MIKSIKFVKKVFKGLYLVNVNDKDRPFVAVKTRKTHNCIVTGGTIPSGKLAYVTMPTPNTYISVIGMHLLRNNLNPDVEDFVAKYICENMDDVYEYIDNKKGL